MYLYSVEKIISPNNSLNDIKMLNDLISNAECMHTTLGKLFNVANEKNWRTKYNVLYKRLIQHTCKFIVQSDIKIDENKIKELGFNVNEIKLHSYKNNDIINISMNLAPFRKSSKESRKTIIKTPEERVKWITNKLSHNNECEVLNCVEKNIIINYMEHSKKEKGYEMLQGCTYEVKLRINDIEAFNSIINKGIGPCKAYGFGLVEVVG